MSPERLRDATFQRLSDWTDARFGIGCFGLARRLLVVTSACTLATAVSMHGADQWGPTVVVEWVTAAVAQLLASGWLAARERRFAATDRAAVIPFLRDGLLVTFGFVFAVIPLLLGLSLAYYGLRLILVAGPTPFVVSRLVQGGVMVFSLSGTASALLFATCSWNRRPRAPSRSPRLVASSA